MKNVAVLTDDVAFALFFRPHPGGFGSSKVPPNQRREFAIQNANDRGSAGGGGGGGGGRRCAQLELTDA